MREGRTEQRVRYLRQAGFQVEEQNMRMHRGRDKPVASDMGSEYDDLAILRCVRNTKAVVCQRPRQHIFIESVEQEELPRAALTIALREASKRLRTARFICLDSLIRQDRRNGRIHIGS